MAHPTAGAVLFTVIAVLHLILTPAAAQVDVAVGDYVRLTVSDRVEPIQGRLLGAKGDSLTLTMLHVIRGTRGFQRRRTIETWLSTSSIVLMEKRVSRRSYAAVGMGTGLVTGAIIGGVVPLEEPRCPPDRLCIDLGRPVAVVGVALTGALIGWIAGRSIVRERWEPATLGPDFSIMAVPHQGWTVSARFPLD